MAPRKRRNVSPPISPVVDVVGGWLGGRRGSASSTTGSTADDRQRAIDRGNQTQLLRNPSADVGSEEEFYPIYPEPQSIRNMPFQNAGYDDAFNRQGRRASTLNVTEGSWSDQEKAYIPASMEKFFNDVETVYINPTYMYEYIDGAGSADTKERKAKNYSGLTGQLQGFADANSKYFDKKFQVLKAPKRGGRGTENIYEGKYSNPTKTLQLDIDAYNDPDTRAIAMAPMRFFNPQTKPRGADKGTPYGPMSTSIYWNNANNDFGQFRGNTQAIMQHEFGHTLGRGHSLKHTEGDANTVLSYDSKALQGYSSKLGPSDINYYKEVQKTLAKEKAERIRARNNARIANPKTNKNKRIR